MENPKLYSLGSRLGLLFAAVTLPLLVLLLAIGNYAKTVVLSQVAHSYQNLVDSNIRQIDRSLDDISSNLFLIVNQDPNFLQLAQADIDDAEYYFAQMGLQQRNLAYQSYYHTVDLYFVHSRLRHHTMFTGMPETSGQYAEEIRNQVREMMNASDRLEDYFYKWSIIRLNGDYYLFRLVGDDMSNNALIGALVSMDRLNKPLTNLDFGKQGLPVFVADDGQFLTGARPPRLEKLSLPQGGEKQDKYFETKAGDQTLFVVHQGSSKSGFHMAVVLPRTALLQGLDYFQAAINLLPVAVLAILLLYLLMIHRLILMPVKRLLATIRRVKGGDMEARLPATRILDFSLIHHSFNGMLNEIKDLKINIYEEKLRVQQAELRQLQTQINPHFFLNTLNVIFQLADLKRHELIKKTVRHMVQYFRFLMTTTVETVTVDQEMIHISNYLDIQKMRYQDTFDYGIAVEERLKDVRIPRLIVQPFVENAMIHGFSLREGVFRLSIDVSPDEAGRPGMRIVITDNGKGFTEEQLTRLRDESQRPEEDTGHIGIWNVRRRLSLRYGNGAAAVTFANHPAGGAIVSLSLPIHLDGEEV